MSIITGTIDHDGAAVDVLIGVSGNRCARLVSVGHPIPPEASLRLQIDTGSHVTGFLPTVFQALNIEHFRTILLRTPSTRPGEAWEAKQYDVSLTLISGADRTLIPSVHAIASEDFDVEEGIQGIIGRDVLDRCVFEYFGPHKSYRLSF